jgi:four helix bundle protein
VAKRRYEKHFLSKLTDSDGEREETQHWIETARDCGYLADADEERLLGYCEEIGKMLASMRARAEMFCPASPVLREDSDESDL